MRRSCELDQFAFSGRDPPKTRFCVRNDRENDVIYLMSKTSVLVYHVMLVNLSASHCLFLALSPGFEIARCAFRFESQLNLHFYQHRSLFQDRVSMK
ncbi:hypothetical protein AVEN_58804-1 [Araneus ventricosus]|uniref:Uncharacterized protein n=1 Tax=Araneus ventricosus TaxID=182803 RepID=A0A4Y2U635_ARAVE|nr:hypothetical protein AVEN_42399-1 [Araneus ventricosus]GBO07534.1 hypothetical protein AVEN_58804-1 [Araneus ventricosus]